MRLYILTIDRRLALIHIPLVKVERRVEHDDLLDMRDSSLRESNGRNDWTGDSMSETILQKNIQTLPLIEPL
jgi:hypothetical protein